MEQTIKCPICNKPYVVYMHYTGTQSACPRCRPEAREKQWKDFLYREGTTGDDRFL